MRKGRSIRRNLLRIRPSYLLSVDKKELKVDLQFLFLVLGGIWIRSFCRIDISGLISLSPYCLLDSFVHPLSIDYGKKEQST